MEVTNAQSTHSKEYQFNNFVYAHYIVALNYARSFRASEQDAEDLLSESFIKIYERLNSGKVNFAAKRNGWGYLRLTIKNTAITRSADRERCHNFTGNSVGNDDEYQDFSVYSIHSYDAIEEYDTQELMALVQERIEEIEYGNLLMKYAQGFKYAELADEYDLPLGTIKHRIFSARQAVLALR